MKLRTCVHPDGRFIVGVHRPHYRVKNLRRETRTPVLGAGPGGAPVTAAANFPEGDVSIESGDWVYEVANPFPFRGATYTSRFHADRAAAEPDTIRLTPREGLSLGRWLAGALGRESLDPRLKERFIQQLPGPLKLTVAAASSDPEDLAELADACCEFIRDPATGRPTGVHFEQGPDGGRQPIVHDHRLFHVLGNNPHLPGDYKRAMVLRPGIQGGSEIVGDWRGGGGHSHVYEYLRKNSYIPWGHYAANMADDSVRYRVGDLSPADMSGMRHLFYRRTFLRLAEACGVSVAPETHLETAEEIEALRRRVVQALTRDDSGGVNGFSATLWGWNYGFGYAPTGYRLHASHQQIHQQYALIPTAVSGEAGETHESFACGMLVEEFVECYRQETGKDFFDAYLEAVATNRRMDGKTGRPACLVVFEDPRVVLFVPKAQTSQWELQLVTRSPVGNLLEADTETRTSLDLALWAAIRVLTGLGAEMVTTIEFSKRFGAGDTGQRLLYSLLPRLPNSPGAFSEAQLRWINRHYPEDFADLCRRELAAGGTG
jgi:hypothetical protein